MRVSDRWTAPPDDDTLRAGRGRVQRTPESLGEEEETTMTGWFAAGTMAVLLVAGCADARKPSVRRGTEEPDSQSTGTVGSTELSPSMPSAHAVPEALGPEVYLGTMYLTAPEGWIRKQPRSGFVLAEFSLPRAEGDEADGRLTVTAVGGSIEDNVARWRQQFGGRPERESQEDLQIAGVEVALVDFSGTYDDTHMGMPISVERPGYRMRGAIFSIGGQQFIIKCYGPEKTMAQQADGFVGFIRSLKPIQPEAGVPESKDTEANEPESAQLGEGLTTPPHEAAKPASTGAEANEPESGESEAEKAQPAEGTEQE
jgi:hypothetical protein